MVFSSVQSLSHVQLFETSWNAAHQASLSITNSWSLLKLMSIKSVMPSCHLILCCPLLLMPPIPPSIRVFSSESTLRMRWPKYWSFNLSISSSNEHPGLVSFRMDRLDLLAVQGTFKSLLQSNHLILCCPLLLLPPIPPSIRVFSNESTLHMRWPKYWSFSFSIISSKEIPGLISFRMDWLDLLAVQGTLKSLLQHHNSKTSILQRSAFFTVQLSHPYMTTGKTIALTRRTFVAK